ncbi:hypothetical protein [Oceanibium sediminis]|uniref:hypothetical protein n=1 Tax=Oceanibium sediminis TaxID=2026339 RepID=UPI000DD35654|nr:hypothetical protein [Oceanibium sediminis]
MALADPINSGTASYSGVAGFGVGENDDTFVQADIELTADFGASQIDAGFQNCQIFTDEGTLFPDAPTYTPFQTGAITGSTYSASTANEVLMVEGEAYTIQANIEGAFVGAGSSGTIGLVDGSITNPDATIDEINGLFVAEQN